MDEVLNNLISDNAHLLQCPEDINGAAVLHAFAEVESGHGARGKAAKHESAYCYGGFYWRAPAGETLRELSRVHGCLAHCSYSSWQIMYITAVELGFQGDPTALRDDAVALPFVIKLINDRILAKYPRITTAGLADAYNSGSPVDTNVPKAYIAAFQSAYTHWLGQLT